jgi:hypothetical protein
VPFAAALALSAAAEAEEMQFCDGVGDAAALLVVALGAAAALVAAVVVFDPLPLFAEPVDESPPDVPVAVLEPVAAETLSILVVLCVVVAVAGTIVCVVVEVLSDAPVIQVHTPLSQPQKPPSELPVAEALGLAEAEEPLAGADDLPALLVAAAGAVVCALCALGDADVVDGLGVGLPLVADALGDGVALEVLGDALAEADCVDVHTVGKGSALLGFAAMAGAAANATPTRATTALGTPTAAIRRRERSAWARRRWERAVTGTDHSCSVVGSVPCGPDSPTRAACSMTWVFSAYSACSDCSG